MADLNALFARSRNNGDLPEGYKSTIIGPSQLSTFGGTKESCQRKWWWQSVCKLPQPPRKATAFGTVLHSVLERYYLADDNGWDRETGEAVDLYPAKWHIATDYNGKEEPPLTAGEQALIQKLIDKGLEDGVIRREPNREVEAEIWRKLAVMEVDEYCLHCGELCGDHFDPESKQVCPPKCPDCGPVSVELQEDFPEMPFYCTRCKCNFMVPMDFLTQFAKKTAMVAFLLGYMDLTTPGQVDDHKTTSNMKYALGTKRLSRDPKMLLYAHELFARALEAGRVPPDRVVMRLNYFSKKPEDARLKVSEAPVKQEQAVAAFEEAQGKALDMMRIRTVHGRDADKWQYVEGADEKDYSRACNAYGGCAYLRICLGQETPTDYKKRIDRVIKNSKNTPLITAPKKSPKEVVPMAGFAARLAAMAAAKKSVSTGVPQPKLAATPAVVVPDEVTPPLRAETVNPNTVTVVVAPPAPAPQPAAPSGGKRKSRAKTKKTTGMDGLTPPWARADCKACAGSGINSKGNPCRICDSKQKKAGEAVSTMFVLEVAEGVMYWEPKDGVDIPAGVTEVTPPVKATILPPPPPAPEVDMNEPEVEVEGDKHDKPAPVYVALENLGADQGITLYLGCAPLKSQDCVKITSLLEMYGQEIADERKVESYWVLPLNRRDLIRARGKQIAAQLGTLEILVPSSACADATNLTDALLPHAAKVVVGTTC